MRWFVDEEAPMAIEGVHFPLSEAATCLNCGACFRFQQCCPACTSGHIESVETWLTRAREVRQRADYEYRVVDELKQLTKGLER